MVVNNFKTPVLEPSQRSFLISTAGPSWAVSEDCSAESLGSRLAEKPQVMATLSGICLVAKAEKEGAEAFTPISGASRGNYLRVSRTACAPSLSARDCGISERC